MANYVYPNEILQDKYNTVLKSKMDINNYLTVDNSLTASEGDDIEVVSRSVSGSFEDVAMGSGNSGSIEVTGTTSKYTVKTKQGRFVYYDEEARKDGKLVDTGITGMAEIARNAWSDEAIVEFEKAFTYNVATASISFNDFVDAIAYFGEDAEDIVALVNPSTLGTVRKNLKDDLKYSEDFVRTGYVGAIAGVPVKSTNLIPAGEVILAKKDAVTLFLKKDTEMEQERDANLRKNSIYSRKVGIVALTKDSHVVRIGANATTPTTVTTYTKAQKTVAGAATTGADVRVFVNGAFKKSAVASSSAYSVILDANLVAGDKIKVVAHKDGQIASVVDVTVAE